MVATLPALQLYNLNSAYGTHEELLALNRALLEAGIRWVDGQVGGRGHWQVGAWAGRKAGGQAGRRMGGRQERVTLWAGEWAPSGPGKAGRTRALVCMPAGLACGGRHHALLPANPPAGQWRTL